MKLGALAACVMAGLLGCGGDDDGNLDCSDYSACGGNPVGEWTIADACIDGAPEPEFENCPDATAAIDDVVVHGTIDIQDDGSSATTIDTSATIVITVPMSCLQGGTCQDLAQAAGVPCSDHGDDCDCISDFDDSQQESGSWGGGGAANTTPPA